MSTDVTSPPFVITRELSAPRSLVFAALTQAEHLQHWMTPPGCQSEGGMMDLRVGGTYHYGMRYPDGSIGYGKWTFREIVAPERLVTVVQFSDAKGGVTRHPMAPNWPLYMLSTITLAERGGKTLMQIELRALNASDEETRMFSNSHAGMEHGWSGTFTQLESYLETVKH